MLHSETFPQKQKKKDKKYYLAQKVSNTEAKKPWYTQVTKNGDFKFKIWELKRWFTGYKHLLHVPITSALSK